MQIKTTIKLFVTGLLLNCFTANSQILYSEDFESVTPPALPAGWLTFTEVPATDSTDLWLTGDSSQANSLCPAGYFYAKEHTKFAYTNDGRCDAGSGACMGTGGSNPGCNKTKDFLQMPSFSLSGLSGYQLKFASFHDQSYGGNLYLQVSLNGSAWSTYFTIPVDSTKWITNTLSLSPFNGIAAVSFRFYYNDGGVWVSGVAIDDVVVEKIPPDLGVAAITKPVTTCGLSSSESVIIKVKNYGLIAYDTIPVAYSINGGTPVKDTIFSSINAGDTLSHTFSVKADLFSPDSYSFNAWTDFPSDFDKSNDSVKNYVVYTNLYLEGICIYDTDANLGQIIDCSNFTGDICVDGSETSDFITTVNSDSIYIDAPYIQSIRFTLYARNCGLFNTETIFYLNGIQIGTFTDTTFDGSCDCIPTVTYPKIVTISDSAILNSAYIIGKNVFSVDPDSSSQHTIAGYMADVFAPCSTVCALTSNVSNIVNVDCKGNSTGSATVIASDGAAPIQYLWNDPATQTSNTATGLAQGNYSVIITDNNGCTTTKDSITITEPAVLTASISDSVNVACKGNSTGSATVIASGGTNPYTYLWDDPAVQTINKATVLAQGNYTVIVTDNKGCKTNASVTITEPLTAITAIISDSVNIVCKGNSTGSATVTASSGTSPYTYLWNDLAAQTNYTATGLAQGNYTVIVTDNKGCKTNASVTITEPLTAITASISNSVNVDCKENSTGSATVVVSNGIAPIIYLWNDPAAQTSNTATGLTQGNYAVTVTDNNECKTNVSVTITEPLAALATTITTNPETNGGSKGNAIVVVNGGTSPYSYLWDDPASQVNGTASGLSAGTYHVTVTDANGCYTVDTATVGIIEGINDPFGNSYLYVFPNPFTGETTLKYIINQNSKVKIELFNLIGEKIETVVDNNQSKGTYQYVIGKDYNKYNSGVYIIKFTLNGEVSVKKLIKLL